MKKILSDIQSGKFTRDWMMECEVNQPHFKAMRNKSKKHSIEVIGKKLRDMMPWIGKNKLVDTKKN
jgi:ketol-acid reductoisomerase